MTTPTTIELFPGVQFRKDTTKPLGNQWMFEHEGCWLIAKLAYADDLSLDHVAKVMAERDRLASLYRQSEKAIDRIHCMYGKRLLDLTGERQTVLIPDEEFVKYFEELKALKAENQALTKDAERYRSMRNCPWPGSMQQVGIMHRDDDANWLKGDDADRAVDAAMEPAPVDDVLVIPIPGTEVLTPITRPWKEVAEPVAADDRKCHEPDCWACEGTGREELTGSICIWNDSVPF